MAPINAGRDSVVLSSLQYCHAVMLEFCTRR